MKINSAPLYYCDFSKHLNTSSGVLAKSFCLTVTSRGSGRKSKLTTSRGVIFFAAQKKEHTGGWPRFQNGSALINYETANSGNLGGARNKQLRIIPRPPLSSVMLDHSGAHTHRASI
jgi:hypothetical protein